MNSESVVLGEGRQADAKGLRLYVSIFMKCPELVTPERQKAD
jgi:hypothetical protein